jgi:hypothetical protein
MNVEVVLSPVVELSGPSPFSPPSARLKTKATMSNRLKSIATQLLPDVKSSTETPLPSFDELPWFKNFPGCAWGVWGPEDQLGTVNLLTEEVVQRAAAEEIR